MDGEDLRVSTRSSPEGLGIVRSLTIVPSFATAPEVRANVAFQVGKGEPIKSVSIFQKTTRGHEYTLDGLHYLLDVAGTLHVSGDNGTLNCLNINHLSGKVILADRLFIDHTLHIAAQSVCLLTGYVFIGALEADTARLSLSPRTTLHTKHLYHPEGQLKAEGMITSTSSLTVVSDKLQTTKGTFFHSRSALSLTAHTGNEVRDGTALYGHLASKSGISLTWGSPFVNCALFQSPVPVSVSFSQASRSILNYGKIVLAGEMDLTRLENHHHLTLAKGHYRVTTFRDRTNATTLFQAGTVLEADTLKHRGTIKSPMGLNVIIGAASPNALETIAAKKRLQAKRATKAVRQAQEEAISARRWLKRDVNEVRAKVTQLTEARDKAQEALAESPSATHTHDLTAAQGKLLVAQKNLTALESLLAEVKRDCAAWVAELTRIAHTYQTLADQEAERIRLFPLLHINKYQNKVTPTYTPVRTHYAGTFQTTAIALSGQWAIGEALYLSLPSSGLKGFDLSNPLTWLLGLRLPPQTKVYLMGDRFDTRELFPAQTGPASRRALRALTLDAGESDQSAMTNDLRAQHQTFANPLDLSVKQFTNAHGTTFPELTVRADNIQLHADLTVRGKLELIGQSTFDVYPGASQMVFSGLWPRIQMQSGLFSLGSSGQRLLLQQARIQVVERLIVMERVTNPRTPGAMIALHLTTIEATELFFLSQYGVYGTGGSLTSSLDMRFSGAFIDFRPKQTHTTMSHSTDATQMTDQPRIAAGGNLWLQCYQGCLAGADLAIRNRAYVQQMAVSGLPAPLRAQLAATHGESAIPAPSFDLYETYSFMRVSREGQSTLMKTDAGFIGRIGAGRCAGINIARLGIHGGQITAPAITTVTDETTVSGSTAAQPQVLGDTAVMVARKQHVSKNGARFQLKDHFGISASRVRMERAAHTEVTRESNRTTVREVVGPPVQVVVTGSSMPSAGTFGVLSDIFVSQAASYQVGQMIVSATNGARFEAMRTTTTVTSGVPTGDRYEVNTSTRTFGTNIQASKVYVISSSGNISLTNVNFQVGHTLLSAPNGVIQILAGLDQSYRARHEHSGNIFWQRVHDQRESHHVPRPSQFSGTVETQALGVHVETVRGKTLDWLTRLQHTGGKLTTVQLEELHTYVNHKRSGPTVALAAVIALAVTIATQGTGSALASGLVGQLTLTGTSAAVTSAAATAGFTSLCSQAAVALVESGGDLDQAAKRLTSGNAAKTLLSAMATAGLVQGVGTGFGLPTTNAAASQSGVVGHIQHQALQATASAAVAVASGESVGDAVVAVARTVAAGVVGAVGANQLSQALDAGFIDTFTHKLAHAGLGAVTGTIIGGERGALAGAIAAPAAEIIATCLKEDPAITAGRALEKGNADGIPLTEKNLTALIQGELQTTIDLARLGGAITTLLAGQDAAVGIQVATNAVENNFQVSAANEVLAAYAIVTAVKGQALVQEANETLRNLSFEDLEKISDFLDRNEKLIDAGLLAVNLAPIPPYLKAIATTAPKVFQALVKGIRLARISIKVGARNPPAKPATAEVASANGSQIPKDLKSYVREIELQTGVKVHPKQRELLAQDLRQNQYRKLTPQERLEHNGQFTKAVKDKLIDQWERNLEQTWPTYQKPVLSKDGRVLKEVGERYDAHHINPQQLRGPHEWWNIHPAQFPRHQTAIHGKNSALAKILGGLD